jgi:eukaryotic-like serine/threonine-protein kinase
VHVVIRRGLQYLLAPNVLRVAVFLPLALLVAGVVANPNRTVADIVTRERVLLAFAGAAVVVLRFRSQLSLWLDRRFFREVHDAEQVLLALMDDVRASDSLAQTARLVGERVQGALHSERILVFYRDLHGGHLGVRHSSTGGHRELRLPDGSPLLGALEREGRVRDVLAATDDMDEGDRQWLTQTSARLLVPIGGGDRKLVGLIVLGEKRSGQPYTRTEGRLLEGVSAQIGIVYEKTASRERLASEEREKREALSRLAERCIVSLKECPACGACYDGTEEACARDATPLRLSLPVARTIEGKYRLEHLIGRGGMGAVYAATDLRLGRAVAVKIITARLFGEHDALRRFEREARTAAALQHRNVVAIYDYGQIGDGAYFVMELLDGVTLRDDLHARGHMSPPEAATVFDQVLEALQVAHARGIVHRDLKPDNVFLAKEVGGGTVVKILDFGLAKVRQAGAREPGSLTLPGAVIGTLGYSSPEQLAGRPVDERTDIFALGIMVAEAITGAHPFAANPNEVVTAILHQPFRLEGDAPEVKALESVLSRCLAKMRAERTASAAEVQHMLIPALRRCPGVRVSPSAPRNLDGAGVTRSRTPIGPTT